MNSDDLKKAPKWFQKWYSNDFTHLVSRVDHIYFLGWGILFALIGLLIMRAFWG